MMRAGLYLRQSFDRHDDKLAVTRQDEDCTRLCADRGWQVVERYTDNDKSASTGKPRPAYERLLADVRAGLLDAVVTWDLDRLHRHPAELEEFITLADEKQLALATVGGDHDLATDGGRLFARIKGAVSKSEVERKSARQKRANQQHRAAGRWNRAGMRKFGYTKTGALVESEAALLRQVAHDVLAGKSLRSIAIEWNERGLRTVPGSKWTSLQVGRMLKNPLYAGLMTYKGRVVGPGEWEPVISKDVHDGLVAYLSDPSRKPAVSFERRYMGSGVYRCGICGQAMYAMWPGGRKRGLVYACRPSSHVARQAAPLDEFVERLVLDWLGDPDTGKRLKVMLDGNGNKVNVGALHTKRAALQAKLDDLAGMFAAGDIDASQLKRGTTDLRTQLAGVDTRLADLSRRSPVADLLAAGKDVEKRWKALSPDMKGKVVSEIMTVIVPPARRRGPGFDYDLIADNVEWHDWTGQR
jgi:site-specific DNA recombinase